MTAVAADGKRAVTLAHCQKWVREKRKAIKNAEDESRPPDQCEKHQASTLTGPEPSATDAQSTPDTGLVLITVYGLPTVLARFSGCTVYALEDKDGKVFLSTDRHQTSQADATENGNSTISEEAAADVPMVQAAAPEKRLSVHSTRQLELKRTRKKRERLK